MLNEYYHIKSIYHLLLLAYFNELSKIRKNLFQYYLKNSNFYAKIYRIKLFLRIEKYYENEYLTYWRGK